MDFSETSSKVAKQVPGPEVLGVQSMDLWESGSMGADQRDDSCDGSKSRSVTHVEKWPVRITELQR
jgi:hypothetical protein